MDTQSDNDRQQSNETNQPSQADVQRPTQPLPQQPLSPQQPMTASAMPNAPYEAQPTVQKISNSRFAVPALVCGILSIVFCIIPVINLVLAIVAVVLASKAKHEVRGSDAATGGFVCGIIGILLAVILTIAEILLVVGIAQVADSNKDFSYEVTSALTQPSTTDEAACKKATSDALDSEISQLSSASDQFASEVDSSFYEASGMHLSDFGIEPSQMAKWMFSDITYQVGDVEIDGTDARVGVVVSTRDVQAFTNKATNDITAYASKHFEEGFSSDTYKAIGKIIVEDMNATGTTPQPTAYVQLSKTNGEWQVDQDALDDTFSSFF
ncbi:MAG: DUF4190 domain-containing protein [Eggerthellaceae bacterium]|jgi:hypothetical protein|nr:DUF4190 domain-containing protein [Eggerthellaceae bacterium]MCH4221281.1 DUF4190 domain-containing protein [Eggerthellaceae bacterium]